MDRRFDIDLDEFQARKRRRIAAMDTAPPPAAKVAPTSAPAVHEIAGYLPGRLEFEHELDNEAEDLVKDLEFGACYEFGGDELPEDEQDPDVKARAKWVAERRAGKRPTTAGVSVSIAGKTGVPGGVHGPVVIREVAGKRGKKIPNGSANGTQTSRSKLDDKMRTDDDEEGDEGDDEAEEQMQPQPIESQESLEFKLTLMEMYRQRLDKRQENKQLMLQRGLLDYKKVHA
jgi:transcriptional adapter 2-alpha